MFFKLHTLAILIVACSHGHAADLDAVKRTPAKIEVVNMQPILLVASTDNASWTQVPAQFTKYGAIVHMPTAETNGVAEIKVTGDGYLLLACSFDYQGNIMLRPEVEIWNDRKFKNAGWSPLGKPGMGGDLVKGIDRTQTVYIKQVRKGETLILRCNKKEPPYPILLGAKI